MTDLEDIAGLEALLVEAQEEIAELKAALRPFADAKRQIEANNPPNYRPIGPRVDWIDLVRAAELVPPVT